MHFLLILAILATAAPTHAKSPARDADYCAIETEGASLELVRPAPGEEPVDDVNWFARPLPNDRGQWIIAFASHDQNYLYNLTTGKRIKIPDRSDAVGTPDGRYVTVPSHYTPDQYIRFYDAAQLVDSLDRGVDADGLAPAYVHVHPDLRKVYYQSTAVVSTATVGGVDRTTYRLMFSGTRDEAAFRIVDYEFVRDAASGKLEVHPSEPMKLCPEIRNDLSTPFISKDGRYVVAYTSNSDAREFTPGSSLKIFRIADVLPREGATRCEEVVDFGFAAGKADFSFDGSELAFHISKGGYLTPFVNGGLEPPTVTDVVVVELTRNAEGRIDGYSGMARVTTSLREGVGSYFPAFLPDGKLFYVFNAEPKTSTAAKRFYFKVVDPEKELTMASLFAEPRRLELASAIGRLWEGACATEGTTPLKDHEAPWVLASLSGASCRSLVEDQWKEHTGPGTKEDLLEICSLRQ
jgi:hypothetical protein